MVDLSSHIRRGHPITFLTFTIISFIVAVIASTLVTDYNSKNNAPSMGVENAVRFLVFAGWWGFLFSIIYVGLFLTGKGGVITSIAGHGIWIFVTWVFWMAGAAALTDRIGGGQDCGNSFLVYCNSTSALMAFAWIGWIILTFMLAVVAFIGGGAFRGGKSVKEGLA
ncbi:hypothetical protein IE53DRAFT_336976 [Violaceomyces palustris]|uniref:Uncharacterized protein n=1 Tax=Violaceomyces palustris TaxID=1673888 RepID=A0ACD0P8V1_9BASI|nr:hypothetical protein IE53DRAFT_336976 [Violaceomyces palustris]